MSLIYWALILMLLGLATIALEMFVPSAGLLGFLAAAFIISAIVVAFTSSLQAGAIMLLATVVFIPVFIAVAVKIWPNTPIGRRVLIGTVNEEDVLPVGEHYESLKNMVGRRGVAKSKMLPSGLVVIEGEKIDAVSEGMAIEPGDPIQVVAVRTNKVIVRKVDPSETIASSALEDDDILSKPIDDVFET